MLVRDRPGLRLWEGWNGRIPAHSSQFQVTLCSLLSSTASGSCQTGQWQAGSDSGWSWNIPFMRKAPPFQISFNSPRGSEYDQNATFVLGLKSINLAFLTTMFFYLFKVRGFTVKILSCYMFLRWVSRKAQSAFVFYIWSYSSVILSLVFRTETLPARTIRWNPQAFVNK